MTAMGHPLRIPSHPTRPVAAARRAVALLGGALLALGACTDDPFERPGTWRATGVNDANMRAQIVDPAQLQRGAGAGTDRGQAGSAPITVLEAGKRPQVPSTELARVGRTSGAGGASGAR